MKVPLLDLKAQFQIIQEEIRQKLEQVISSQQFILGPEVEELEKEIADYTGVEFAVGVSSGSDALLVSLMALGVGDGDVVVTTPFTFFATAGSVARLKAAPLFCDIDEESFNISPAGLEELLETQIVKKGNSSIKAILPVHLYGQCADMEPLLKLAKTYSLFIVEDAAQAIGAEYPMSSGIKKAGSMGDAGTLSFFPSKNLGGFGDGGMVLTNSEELAREARLLRVHGSKKKYYSEVIGGNFRLDALQAAVLRVKLNYLGDWQEERRKKADYYDQEFRKCGLVDEGLVIIPERVHDSPSAGNTHVFHQYTIRCKKRDELKEFLKERGVSTAIYYPFPLHLQKCFSHLGFREGDFPESEKASREVLSLPIYPELSREQQDFVLSSIQDFYSR